jgi:site-specific DNA recombinase
MESAWSNGNAAYRCRHGHTSVAQPDPGRPGNAYIREDRILAHLPALHLLLTGTEPAGRRRRTRRGADARPQAGPEHAIGYLRDRGITLTYDPAAGTLQAGTCQAAKTTIRKAS